MAENAVNSPEYQKGYKDAVENMKDNLTIVLRDLMNQQSAGDGEMTSFIAWQVFAGTFTDLEGFVENPFEERAPSGS